MSADPNASLTVDLAIVGGGPAGAAAAIAAAELGLKCLIVERSGSLGGQIVGVQSRKSGARREQDVERTEALCRRLNGSGVELITGATVWNVEPSQVLHLVRGSSHHRVTCHALLVATGARERPMPFAGWTLPGVMTCGAAQRLTAQSGVVPGNRVLVAGRGPLLLRAAAELIEAGVHVVAMVEATGVTHLAVNGLRTLAGSTDRARQAGRYARRLLGAGVPMLFGHVVVEAGGDGPVEWATIAPLDRGSRPVRDRKRSMPVDAICVSNGLEPNIELFQALGCELVYDVEAQAFFPRHDEALRTSVPWVYAAGEVTGIGGAPKSLIEGEIAGIQAALGLGAVQEENVAIRLRKLVRQRRKRLRQARSVDHAYVGPDLYLRIADPDTLACRCEEITLGELRAAVLEGNGFPRDAKLRTRIGMGICQGRMCLTTLYQELASGVHHPSLQMEPIRVRPPLEPVPLGQLAELVTSDSDTETVA